MKLYLLKCLCFVLICSLFTAKVTAQTIKGELKTWHKITLSFDGPETSEYDTLNPFLNYRLDVIFKHNETDYTLKVPGFYNADGLSAETSANTGNQWQVRFCPPRTGLWTYVASFRTGTNIAIDDDDMAGKPTSFDGLSGELNIAQTDKTGRDLRAKGRLTHPNGHFLQFANTGESFIKGGANSPENLLGYFEFDQTPPSHRFEAHSGDFKTGDPTWKGQKGKNIVGALNYLASTGANSVYFLSMNVMGDGKDVWPWTAYHERYRYDCSKLDQWEIIFDHMDRLGLVKHVITQETENENLLDIGYLGIQRKLYYRELVARFGHHPGIVWNMGEENGMVHWSPIGQTDKQRNEMISYIKSIDPYKNPVFIHTLPDPDDHLRTLTPLLENVNLDGLSIQIHNRQLGYQVTDEWRTRSSKTGNPWVIWVDEIGPAGKGVLPDNFPDQQDSVRKEVIWSNLMAGGSGIEHYFGYKFAHNDLNCEDWRSRERIWAMTHAATDFFSKYVKANEANPDNKLVRNMDAYCLVNGNSGFIVYLKGGASGQLNLTNYSGKFTVKWFNPRTGGGLSKPSRITAGSWQSLGNPPADDGQDWVALVQRK